VQHLLAVKEHLWPAPGTRFYDRQLLIVESVLRDRETYVVAGNQLGKDYIAGFICVAAFIACLVQRITCRIVTTSVSKDHLKVLWGEIGRFLTQAEEPLVWGVKSPTAPLVLNFQEIRRLEEYDAKNPYNYCLGFVYADSEKIAGHHADWTLFVGDEASGLEDVAYEKAQGWAKHQLIFGNPHEPRGGTNFFKRAVQAGDLIMPDL
jgi:hypothetical protein